MRFRFLILLVAMSACLFYSDTAFAQDNFLPGKVVNTTGDTLTGFIDYHRWKRNPEKIRFKNNMSGKDREFSPEDISTFQVSNDVYLTREITVTHSPRHTANITFETVQPSETKTAFILVLVSGKASLYQYVDDMTTEHYYIETDSNPLMELIYFKYYRYENKVRVIAENLRFKGQLTAYLSDCPEIKNQAGQAKYQAEALSKVIVRYNECMNYNDMYVHKVEKIKWRFGIFAGASLSTFVINDNINIYDDLDDISFDASINPTFGISLLMLPARGRGHWSAFFDLQFRIQNYEAQTTVTENEEYYSNYEIAIGAATFKFGAMARYSFFIEKKVVPYVGVGGYAGKSPVYTNQVDEEAHFYDTYREYSEPFFELGTHLIDFGLSINAGAAFKKFNVDLRYERGLRTPFIAVAAGQTLYLTVGYTFN